MKLSDYEISYKCDSPIRLRHILSSLRSLCCGQLYNYSLISLEKYSYRLYGWDPLCKDCLEKLPKILREEYIFNIIVSKLKKTTL